MPKAGDKLCSKHLLPDQRKPQAEVVKVDGSQVTFKWLPDTSIGKRYEESGQPNKEITINWRHDHNWMILR